MLKTLSIDTKIPNIWNFPQNYTVQAFYLLITLKTQDTQCNFPKESGNSPFHVHSTDKSSKSVRENSKNLGFSTNRDFSKIYCNFICGLTGIKNVNISAITQKFIVALFYKINPVQITTIVAENTKNSLNLVPHTIEISIQICEKFSPIVKLTLAFFSSAMAIVTPLLLIALMLSVKGSN